MQKRRLGKGRVESIAMQSNRAIGLVRKANVRVYVSSMRKKGKKREEKIRMPEIEWRAARLRPCKDASEAGLSFFSRQPAGFFFLGRAVKPINPDLLYLRHA